MSHNIIKNELQMIYSTKAQSQGGKRQTWIDFAKGIAIILVVMGHRGFITPRTSTWISSFHLPLFFMASGILFQIKKERELEAKIFVVRKIKSLIFPYLIFSFVSMAMDLYFAPSGIENRLADFKLHLVQTLTFQGYSVLWFLPVLFLAEILVFFVFRKCNLLVTTSMFTIVSIILYYLYQFLRFSISSVCIVTLNIVIKSLIAATFLCFGIVFSCVIEKLSYKAGKEELTVTEHVPAVDIFQLLAGIVLFSLNIILSGTIALKDMNNLDLGYLPIYFALGITGSCGLFLICKNCFNIPLLSFYGRNSLIIFCTHMNCYVLYCGTVLYMHFYNHYNLPYFINENFTANIYTMIFTFLLYIPLIYVINVLVHIMRK